MTAPGSTSKIEVTSSTGIGNRWGRLEITVSEISHKTLKIFLAEIRSVTYKALTAFKIAFSICT